MLSIKVKDIKNRQRFKNQELSKIQKKFLSKYFLNNREFEKNSIKKSLLFLYFLKISSKKASKTKIVRRCLLNNRSRVSIRRFGVSRTLFRELLQFGIIPGYVKAVW